MTTLPPLAYFEGAQAALGHRFELETPGRASRERVLFTAVDVLLSAGCRLRVNFYSGRSVRTWFLREAEALAQLDHPAIRHVYDAGVVGELAYRVGNWIEGENLAEAIAARAPTASPRCMVLARDLLGGLEHAHATASSCAGSCPTSLLVNLAGRGTITDLRFSNWTLPVDSPGRGRQLAAVHGPGDPRRRHG